MILASGRSAVLLYQNDVDLHTVHRSLPISVDSQHFPTYVRLGVGGGYVT